MIAVLYSVLFLQHYKANEMTRIHRTDFISAQINQLSCDVYFMSNQNIHCVNQLNENWMGVAQWCYKICVRRIGFRYAWVIENTLTRKQVVNTHDLCIQVVACVYVNRPLILYSVFLLNMSGKFTQAACISKNSQTQVMRIDYCRKKWIKQLERRLYKSDSNNKTDKTHAYRKKVAQ